MNKNQEILMITIGTSPQVITELLYYYSHPFYKNIKQFDKIIVFTTSKGKKEVIENLFNRKILKEMQEIIKIKKINFTEKDIMVIRDEKGQEIDDTTDTESNLFSMNTIFDTLKKYTVKNTSITAAIAGGRKSMSSMMSLAFQMLAREQDELIHIVAPDSKMYDGKKNNHPDKWYYPNDPSNPLEKITVSFIPTLKIGSYLPVSKDGTFEQILHKLQNFIVDLSPLKKIIINKNKFTCCNDSFTLQPMYAALLRYFIKKRINANCKNTCNGCIDCFVDFEKIMHASQNEILDEHKQISGGSNQHYLLKKERIMQYDSSNCELSEQELGELGLKARNRQDLSRLRKAYDKLSISPKLKDTLLLRGSRIDGVRYIGVTINKETKVFFEK